MDIIVGLPSLVGGDERGFEGAVLEFQLVLQLGQNVLHDLLSVALDEKPLKDRAGDLFRLVFQEARFFVSVDHGLEAFQRKRWP